MACMDVAGPGRATPGHAGGADDKAAGCPILSPRTCVCEESRPAARPSLAVFSARLCNLDTQWPRFSGSGVPSPAQHIAARAAGWETPARVGCCDPLASNNEQQGTPAVAKSVRRSGLRFRNVAETSMKRTAPFKLPHRADARAPCFLRMLALMLALKLALK